MQLVVMVWPLFKERLHGYSHKKALSWQQVRDDGGCTLGRHVHYEVVIVAALLLLR
jgi:hypothetical protein